MKPALEESSAVVNETGVYVTMGDRTVFFSRVETTTDGMDQLVKVKMTLL
jgi:hypothetical protein